MKHRLLALATITWLGCAAPGIAANTGFMSDSALAEFRDSDVTMLLAAIDEALALPEGETKTWVNSATGARGSITAGSTRIIGGAECRALAVRNQARGRTGNGEWIYCRGSDGRWEPFAK
jgi:surface antigen